jgi:RNA polymerase sigma-70 factor (ECF subfamily)
MSASCDSDVPELLARARVGDKHALDQLFGACRSYLAVIAQTHLERRLQSKADASDLVQQTMLEAYRDFSQFSGRTEEEWLAWLRRALAHNAADCRRRFRGTDKRQAGREIALEQLAPHSGASAALPAPDETPSRQLMHKERQLQIAQALSRLPEEYQEVIRLRNLQRLPFDEIAGKLGRSRPAVQMLWTRAIRKLQEIVADESQHTPGR